MRILFSWQIGKLWPRAQGLRWPSAICRVAAYPRFCLRGGVRKAPRAPHQGTRAVGRYVLESSDFEQRADHELSKRANVHIGGIDWHMSPFPQQGCSGPGSVWSSLSWHGFAHVCDAFKSGKCYGGYRCSMRSRLL